jgi:hypothetical protein
MMYAALSKLAPGLPAAAAAAAAAVLLLDPPHREAASGVTQKYAAPSCRHRQWQTGSQHLAPIVDVAVPKCKSSSRSKAQPRLGTPALLPHAGFS